MLNIIQKSNEGEKITPHLALTHGDQGGAANGRNVSLLMKNVESMSDEQKAALETFLKSQNPEQVVKASSYNALLKKLNEAVSKIKDGSYDRGWAYVRDFNEEYVVFSNYDGVFAVDYTENSDGSITLGAEKIAVTEMISYEDSSGKLLVTEIDSITKSVSTLVVKSFSTPHGDDDKLRELFKSKQLEGKKMDELQKAQELLKSAQAENETLKLELQKSKEANDAAQAALAAIEKAQAEAKSNQRLETLKAVVAAEEVETLHKSLEALSDEAFDSVVKSLETAKATLENTTLFKTVSGNGVDGEPETQESLTEQLIKQRFKQ